RNRRSKTALSCSSALKSFRLFHVSRKLIDETESGRKGDEQNSGPSTPGEPGLSQTVPGRALRSSADSHVVRRRTSVPSRHVQKTGGRRPKSFARSRSEAAGFGRNSFLANGRPARGHPL